jgi:hypothetical protein
MNLSALAGARERAGARRGMKTTSAAAYAPIFSI